LFSVSRASNPAGAKERTTKMKNATLEIKTPAGILRVWEARPGNWSFATPNGSQGCGEDSFNAAVESAFTAEGLKAAEFGY
jgi:hypothetical protein